MSIEIRPITADELPALVRTTWRAFSERVSDDLVDAYVGTLEHERAVAAFDSDAMVATLAAYTMELTVPGGAAVPVAGLTFVGVLPTHRRRGLLRSLMDHHLDDVVSRGEAATVLLAAESAIYGRFGYGRATQLRTVEVETHHSAYGSLFVDDGSIRLLERDAALDAFQPVFEAFRRRTPGELTRTRELVEAHWKEDEEHEERPWFHALHLRSDGEPDGYVRYKAIDTEWPHGIPRQRLEIEEMVATSPAARAALWRFVLDTDLVERVAYESAPTDEPLEWWLADPRRLTTTALVDHLWVRPVDIEALLAARTYRADGRVVLAVDGRCYELVVDGGAVRCEATDSAPHLRLDAAALGSLYLGGVSFATLAGVGRVVGTDEALDLADRMFVVPTAPYCTTGF